MNTPSTPEFWTNLISQLITHPYFWLGLLVFCLILVLIFVFKKEKKYIEVSTDTAGKVSVCTGALADFIRKHCNELNPASTPNVYIKQLGNDINIKIRVKFYVNQNIGELSNQMKALITKVLKEKLNIENASAINIIVTGFVTPPNGPKLHHVQPPKDTQTEESL